MTDHGRTAHADSKLGWAADIERLTLDNTNFRTTEHTGTHAQLTLMRLAPGEDIGWEAHDHLDQFLRLEQGHARLDMGPSEDSITERHDIADDWAVIVPAGTVHPTKADAEADEHLH